METKFFQKTLPVGRLMCNCQILVSPETHEAVLVDPGDEGDRIVAELKKIEQQLGVPLKVKALLHTHAHFDHIGGTRKVKEHFTSAGIDAPQIFLHQADEFMYQMLTKQSAMFGFQNDEPLPVDQYLQDEQTLQFGKMKFSVIHTPGHSPGGVCFRMHEDSALEIPETVFTGDTLFRESVGRSDLWGADGSTLVKSIHARLLTLDGDTLAWPGHGLRTTIGHEKAKNPYL
jgi:hydroxyacylglutathione hydrolase